MRKDRLLITLGLLAVLTGCSQQISYREGATTAEIQREVDACALRAVRAAPVANQTVILPGEWIPPQKVCDGAGNCTVRPGYRSFPEFETVDVNADERRLLTRTCLAERGIDRVSLPLCDASVKNATVPGVTRVLPKLREQSCLIPRGSGAYQIVP
ncbi:hypothetical protein [Pseudooceanicola onchidii]|uniref:hypothetical protein n=1 Tax=Pseudooceanicola onchidii TaxID=2562279 RepID=UPI0010AA448B|nr:hypothetical protein [Pseudooceanicola onchidii]